MSNPQTQARFDRLLASYQKIAFLLLLPPLMSAFSCVVKLFAGNYNLTFAHAYLMALLPLFPENGPLWTLLIALGVGGLFVPLSLFGAKGKLWCFLIGVALHLADTVFLFTLFNALSPTTFAINLILHGLFIAAYVLGVVYYVRADKLLKENPKDILTGKKE